MSGIALSFLAGGAGGIAYWIATLGGASADQGNAVALDNAGNIYVAGQTISSGAGGDDFLLAKYSPTGVIQWQKVLGGNSTDRAYGIAIDSSNNIYITGDSASNASADYDMVLAKYDTSGNLQWQKSLANSSGYTDDAYAVAVDSSGNVYITGQSFNGSQFSLIVAKYDSSGTVQWQKYLDGASNDRGRSIAVDSSSNVYISGYSNSAGSGGVEFVIAKYDTSGTIQWQRILGGTSSDIGFGIALDSSGNSYITGYSDQGTPGNELILTKYDTSGTIQWQRSLGNSGDNQGKAVAVDTSGNAYVTGQTNGTGAGSDDCLIAKYDTSGNLVWQRTLGTSGAEYGLGIDVDALGSIYITGYTTSNANDVFIAKLPTDGTLTGTYGSWVYQSCSLTAATSALTAATSTFTSATSSLSTSTPTLTSATSTLTSTVITL